LQLILVNSGHSALAALFELTLAEGHLPVRMPTLGVVAALGQIYRFPRSGREQAIELGNSCLAAKPCAIAY
jgi:hypothetical protein